MPLIVGGAILGGSVISGLFGSSASSKAAKAQAAAAAESNRLQREMYQTTRADLGPYREAGSSALGRYRDLLGFNGQGAASTALQGYTQSPFLSQLVKDTTSAVENSRAARGGLFSGGALGEIGNRTGQLYLGDYNNYLSRIGGMIDSGQNAAAQTGSLGANSAAAQGQNLMSAGNAQAQNYINQGNIVGNVLGQAAGIYGAYKGGAFGTPGGSSGGTINTPLEAQRILFGR